MEKTRDAEAKANLQLPFYIREINSRCLKGYYLLVKKDKDDANWEDRNETFSKDKEKTKFYNPSFSN